MRTHIVMQGEYLAKIAARFGLDPDTVWNDASNEDLAAARKDPAALLSGDVLHLPDAPPKTVKFKPGATNAYTATLPKTEVAMVFSNLGAPLANASYEVDGLGAVVKGTTDGKGAATLAVTTLIDSVTVRFPAQNLAFVVSLGHLDPANEPSGALQRLANLGYLLAPPTGHLKAAAHGRADAEAERKKFDTALRTFQRAEGLDETGALDDATSDALVARNGT